MGCLIFLLALLSARIALIFMWIFTNLVDRAFDSFIVPLLGVLFLPWTTLFYVVLWSPRGGVDGWEWILVALGFIIDIGSYGGRAAGRRARYA
jgi:hypothetical protein